MTKKQREELKRKKAKLNAKNTKFWTPERILEYHAQWNMVFGKRGPGKSYGVRERCINEVLKDIDKPEKENLHKFMYLRRFNEDVTANNVNMYFEDHTTIQAGKTRNRLQELSNNRFNGIQCRSHYIWFVRINDEGEIEERYRCGYYYSINSCQSMKSLGFPDCERVVLEEFIALDRPYLKDEFNLVKNIISTIGRGRDIETWLIANNDERDNIYFRSFGLDRAFKMKPGDIDFYQYEPNEPEYDENGVMKTTRIAVEWTSNDFGRDSSQFYGLDNDTINKGAWVTKQQATMDFKSIEKEDAIYEIGFERNGFKWHALFLVDDATNGFFWYVYPNTNPYFRPDSRVISDKISTDPLWTCNLNPLNDGEAKALKVLENGKVFFCDNLTGTEFRRAIGYFMTNTLAQN